MTIISNRNLYRAALIGSFVLLNILLLLGMGRIVDYLNTGADRSSLLHLETEIEDVYLPKVVWTKLENPARKMEGTTLKKIEKDYLFSWYVKNKAFETNSSKGIEDYYTQNTRVNLYQTISYNKAHQIRIESSTIEHNPELEFYSEDGQQVVFTDENVVEFQKIYQDKEVISTVQDTATYKVMMLLEDGFWRVRHMQKMDASPVITENQKLNAVYSVKGNHILKNNELFTIKGINYYPKNSAWNTFGDLFNKDTIANDFEIIRTAKLNTVRIFIQYEDFGKAKVNQEKIAKLKVLLDLAEAKNLSVIVTLFDFYSDYTIDNWTLTHRHAEAIVNAFKNHNAILAWDLKNEPDLDFENRDKSNVLNWLSQIAIVVKENAPNQLITIGWSDAIAAQNLHDNVDFVSYHFYHKIDQLETETNSLAKVVKKPIVIEEFGIPSYHGIWNLWESSVEKQAIYHQKMQKIFKKNEYSFLSWTLYDFPQVPNQVAGKWPWQKNRQKKFGFIDENGNKKASFKYLSY